MRNTFDIKDKDKTEKKRTRRKQRPWRQKLQKNRKGNPSLERSENILYPMKLRTGYYEKRNNTKRKEPLKTKIIDMYVKNLKVEALEDKVEKCLKSRAKY